MQAVAEQLQALGVEKDQLRYVGSRRGQESTLLGAGPIALTLLPGRGIRRSLTLRALASNVVAVLGLGVAVVGAFIKVGTWRPSVVVSVGGYASFATSLAAVLWRRPLVLVEFDATPGASQRILSRFATRRCTAFASRAPRSVTTGPPLRETIVAIDRSDAARHDAREHATPPIESGRSVVVVMTGSLGAHRVNSAASELASLWSSRRDRTIVHVTGRRDFAGVTAAPPETDGLDYRIVEFGDMTQLWALCDVALCRSGAITVGELTALAIPALLVPLPGAPGDHQTKNALAVVDAGGARILSDAQCTGPALATALDDILQPDTLAAMEAASGSLGRRDGATAIARVVLDVSGRS
ncbi:MAG: glycosyltransferase, partial [Acidimicrobiales bacterium]|jgi:UDP-N-acetylglucosamine--N-acetylmuramyl-(pentapeptide) pyrophosphoryl-undecaprenol N-acetylglucosamine transferase